MELYTYFRSSTSYRVRIALRLKKIEADYHYVHLANNGGEQHHTSYRKLNPLGRVPTLVYDGVPITQSMAILEMLDELHPNPPLLPADMMDRAWVRSLANLVACDMHPVNNLSVLKQLEARFGADEAQKADWYRHWLDVGFTALETILAADPRVTDYCYGKQITIADICLVPQVYNAERFQCDMSKYPTIARIAKNCLALDAFRLSSPENQPDANT